MSYKYFKYFLYNKYCCICKTGKVIKLFRPELVDKNNEIKR